MILPLSVLEFLLSISSSLFSLWSYIVPGLLNSLDNHLSHLHRIRAIISSKVESDSRLGLVFVQDVHMGVGYFIRKQHFLAYGILTLQFF